MNDIGQKDVETYVRNLIIEKFKSHQGVEKSEHEGKIQKVRNCSKLKSGGRRLSKNTIKTVAMPERQVEKC